MMINSISSYYREIKNTRNILCFEFQCSTILSLLVQTHRYHLCSHLLCNNKATLDLQCLCTIVFSGLHIYILYPLNQLILESIAA